MSDLFGTIFLASTSIFCHITDSIYKFKPDWINFSGDAIKNGRYQVLILSSFFHGNTSHFLKEITLLIPLCLALEQQIGGLLLILCFLLFSIISCLLTWYCDRIYFSKLYPADGHVLADFIWSRGASASVYGLAAMVPIVCGKRYLFDTSDNQSEWDFLKDIGLFWTILTNISHYFFTKRSRFIQTPLKAYLILGLMLTVLVYCSIVYSDHITQRITISQYISVYFIFLIFNRQFPLVICVTYNYLASDFKSHLFAAGIGIIFGYLIVGIEYNFFNTDNLNDKNIQFETGVVVTNKTWFDVTTISWICIFIADYVFGQLKVEARIRKRVEEKKQRELEKEKKEKQAK